MTDTNDSTSDRPKFADIMPQLCSTRPLENSNYGFLARWIPRFGPVSEDWGGVWDATF
jgi:hypothetical protein